MIIDIVAAVIGLVMAYVGYINGSSHQVIRLLVTLVALTLAYFVGAEMALFHLGVSPEMSARAAVTQWFVISFLVLWGIGTFAASRLARDARDASIDRTLSDAVGGALLGLLRGAIVVYLVIVAMWSRFLEADSFDLPYEESYAAQVCIDKSLLERKIGVMEEFLDTHYTTDPDNPEDSTREMGTIPADERSVY